MKKHHVWLLLAIAIGVATGVCANSNGVYAAEKLAGSKLSIKNVDPTGKVTSKRAGHEDGQDYYTIKGTAKKNSKVYIFADKKGSNLANSTRVSTVKVSKKGNWKISLLTVAKVNAQYYVTQSKTASHKKSKTFDGNSIAKKLKILLPPTKGTEVEPFVASQFATNVTYENLARTPDQYNGKKVMLEGSVMQVMDDELLICVGGDPDQLIHVSYDSTALNGSRVLEDDLVQVYAKAKGTVTYETTNGNDNTIPTLDAAKLVDKGAAPDDYGY